MNIIKKCFGALMRSPYTLPVCGLAAVLSVVHSSHTAKELMTGMTIGERNVIQSDLSTTPDTYISEYATQQQIPDLSEDTAVTVYSTNAVIDLPEASPSEQISEQIPTQGIPTEQESEPIAVQKPAQSTKPQTQKPTEQTTSKPAQTTKPAETAKPQTQITGWNVTLSQAKKMVKADSAYDYEDLYWLSRIISAEAKGESFTGQIGVGTVVLNRVRSGQFPGTVKGVVFDTKYGTQFTPVANGTIYHTPTQSAVIAAKMCLDGYTLSNSVLYFLNPSISTSSWIQNHRKYAFRVGNHEFYY